MSSKKDGTIMSSNDKRVQALMQALLPLVTIANEYDADGLDEARPSWVERGVLPFNAQAEIYAGRGGKCLLTLEQVLHARDIYYDRVFLRPHVDQETSRIRALYEAGIPNLPWEDMSEERRNDVIVRYRKLLK